MKNDPKILSLSELIQLSRPLSGTFSLNSSSTGFDLKNNIFRYPSRSNEEPLRLCKETSTSTDYCSNENPNPVILESLKYPTLIIGTLNLPVDDNDVSLSSMPWGCRNCCFSFSDGSSRVCCDVLDFDIKIIGRKIQVLSWNFIPLQCGQGFLEIIRWSLYDDSGGTINPCSNLNGFPVGSSSGGEEHLRACSVIHGRLESVSPVSVVPCTYQDRSSQTNSDQNSTTPRNLSGFLADLLICKCKVCSSKTSKVDLQDPRLKEDCHSFTVPVIVYFFGSRSSWHPMVSKLLGNVVRVTGLKKKLVLIGKEESCLMLITTEKSAFHMSSSAPQRLPIERTIINGSCEFGTYTGIVTGVYMQGMVVELEEKVWLLLSDRLALPHSLRVGASIYLRNVHFVRPRFSWTTILLLGTCSKTSITVKSFSPVETRGYILSLMQGLLGKFVESLVFSGRFWLFLMVSCFKKKFSGLLSEKEILGSKNKKGLAQMYATSSLPSCAYRARHGVFMEFCKHDMCGCGNEPPYSPLKLVVPICNFISHCEAMWVSTLLGIQNDSKIIRKRNCFSLRSCAGKPYCQMVRKIISSEDLGVVLMGTLQISPSSGRLQLTDATSSVDVVIPDFQSDCNGRSIYEVRCYSVVLEGLPAEVCALGLLKSDTFSCRNIFHHIPQKNAIKPSSIYVHFYLRDATCINVSLDHHFCTGSFHNHSKSQDGVFQLLLITHKFPLMQNFEFNANVSKKSSSFAEAKILPWDLLLLPGEDGETQVGKAPTDEAKKHIEYHRRNSLDNLSNKRPKLAHTSDKASTSRSGLASSNPTASNLLAAHEIHCLAVMRSISGHRLAKSGSLLRVNYETMDGVVSKASERRVLLEFMSETFSRYQGLRVGTHYMIKYAKEEVVLNSNEHYRVCRGKAIVTSKTTICSVSFASSEVMSPGKLLKDHMMPVDSSVNDAVPSTSKRLFFHQSPSQSSENCTDVNLYLSPDAINHLKVENTGSIKLTTVSGDVANISSHIGTIMGTKLPSCGKTVATCRLPQGNLISIHGNVVDVHSSPCDSIIKDHPSYDKSCHNISSQGSSNRICIHVSEDQHLVKLRGAISKNSFPVGLGPGVHASFYRVLVIGQHDLMLIPASFIVINCIKEIDDNNIPSCSSQCGSDIPEKEFSDIVSAGLIPEPTHCLNDNVVSFRCRVLAIQILVLEKHEFEFKNPQVREKRIVSLTVDIPLAGFILDDGSSLRCCWANAERAAKLLRLHEEISIKGFSSSGWGPNIDTPKAQNTAHYHLQKVLNKHQRITMRNHGAVLNSTYEDHTFAVNSENSISNSDDNLLKLIVLNACSGPVVNVVGNIMDSKAIAKLKELIEIETADNSMQNIWVSEIQYVDSRAEASKLIQQLI